jgi:hypothetical protein
MWNEIVTLYIDDASIRLMVTRSQRIRKWAEINLEPGLVNDGVVINETEVASRIKQLINTQKVRQKNIILGYSGLHSLTRPIKLPLLPKAMQPEAVVREARRVLPVQLDQIYLSWCSLPSPKNRTHFFLAATPRKTSDSLVKTVKAAGLNPSRMVFKPLALTKALPENTAILVDMQPSEFDIVIMVEGIAQPIRTVTFPTGELGWPQKLELIASDLERTIKFFDTNNPEKPLDPTTRVYVTGDLTDRLELQTTLAAKTGRKVVVLNARLKDAEKLDTSRFMINMAMSCNGATAVRMATFPAANLNVLPAPYQPKPISLAKVMGIPAGVALAGIAIPLMMMIQSSFTNISSLQNNLDTTNQVSSQKVLQKQNLKKAIIQLEKEAATIKTDYTIIKRSVDSLASQQEIVTGDLEAALGWFSPDLTLTDIRESGGNMIIEGASPNENTILNYARYLDETGRFSSTTVSSISVTDSSMPDLMEQNDSIGFTISLMRKGS